MLIRAVISTTGTPAPLDLLRQRSAATRPRASGSGQDDSIHSGLFQVPGYLNPYADDGPYVRHVPQW